MFVASIKFLEDGLCLFLCNVPIFRIVVKFFLFFLGKDGREDVRVTSKFKVYVLRDNDVLVIFYFVILSYVSFYRGRSKALWKLTTFFPDFLGRTVARE